MDIDDDDECCERFFKIILEPRQDLQKLGIPIKFMSKYGDDLLNVVSLQVPTGKTHIIELLKENGRAWLKDGWPEFVKYYSIYHGHFLMFAYIGSSHFNVFIFDMTTYEIDYPVDHRETEDQKVISARKNNKINRSTNSLSSKENGLLALVKQLKHQKGTLTLEDTKKINSSQLEKQSFVIIMHPSQVTYDFRCNVPRKFAKKYLRTNNKTCTIINATGDTWYIQCEVKSAYVRFSTGWKKYAVDNKLRVGDICVFELINAAKRLFNVEILRFSATILTSHMAYPSTTT